MTKGMRSALGLFAFVTLGVVLTLVGCGSDHRVSASMPVTAADQGQWSLVSTLPEGPAPLGQGGSGSGVSNRGAWSVSAAIDGSQGGVLSIGRYTLTLTPGAFSGTRTITIQADNSGFVQCQLYPEGLKFKRPVQLSMNLLFTNGDDARTSIYWYNPATGFWVDMKGTYDPRTHTVTAVLQHFSRYAAGRAGW